VLAAAANAETVIGAGRLVSGTRASGSILPASTQQSCLCPPRSCPPWQSLQLLQLLGSGASQQQSPAAGCAWPHRWQHAHDAPADGTQKAISASIK